MMSLFKKSRGKESPLLGGCWQIAAMTIYHQLEGIEQTTFILLQF